jgi:hypothetical protein
MQLSTFIATYISNDYRTGRDFLGARGWIALTNIILKRFEQKGFFSLDRVLEVGVEVDNDRWISLPSDYRKGIEIYNPLYPEQKFRYEIVNGKIKLLDKIVTKDPAPVSFTLSSFVAGSVAINDTDAVEDQWKDYLLVASTKNAVVASNTAVSAGLSTLTFLHNVSVTAPMPTSGYLTQQYLMLKYEKSFTGLTSHADEIPVDDKFEEVIAQALIIEVVDKRSKGFANEYAVYKDMISDFEDDQFTPDPGSARPKARFLAGYSDCTKYEDSEYIGDEEETV